jgi:toxin ParE1/3/4
VTPRGHIEPLAREDLRKQFKYLAGEASLETANRFLDAAHATFDELAKVPGLGAVFPARSPKLTGLRVWRVAGFENYLIF